MNALSLFSGIGGIDQAAEWAGIKIVAMCEIEPYPVQVLKLRFPGVPIYDDVRNITKARLAADGIPPVDIVVGGFPCQDLSCAGKQAGLLDNDGNVTRSGLWFEMLRIVRELQPRWVLAENVRNAVNLALDTCRMGLEEEGYEVWPIVVPASWAGAPHKRERLFIVAHSGG
jgi:DNA (cytosine-5)-methyltransferase 1